MGYASTSIGTSWVWLHLHWLFWGIAIFGFVVALIWVSKYAKKDDMRKLMWTTLVIGILGGLITIPLARSGWYDMMKTNHNGNFDKEIFRSMMGDDDDFTQDMFDRMKEVITNEDNK